VIGQQLAQPLHRGEHAGLHRAQWDTGQRCDLTLGVAAEVGEGERLPLFDGRRCSAARTWLAAIRAIAVWSAPGTGVGDQSSPASGAATMRRRMVLSRRTASTALWWISVSSQVVKLPRDGSKRLGSRHSVRKTSCTTSSASPSSLQIRRASE
jgi:hypothetical protein